MGQVDLVAEEELALAADSFGHPPEVPDPDVHIGGCGRGEAVVVGQARAQGRSQGPGPDHGEQEPDHKDGEGFSFGGQVHARA